MTTIDPSKAVRAAALRFRRPTEDDYPRVVGVVDDWWDGRSVHANLRGAGVGRRLYERFFEDARAAGVREIHAITWPGNRRSVAFHRALGFRVEAGPGSQNLYGTPAVAGYDYGTEDRVILSREV